MIPIRRPREFFKDKVLRSGQLAVATDTGREYRGDGSTPGGQLVEADFVQATTEELTGKVYPEGTLVFDTTLGTLARSTGSTTADSLTPIGGGGSGGLQSCRVASTADVSDLASVTTLDGETLADGDVVLLKDQSTASQNGVYEFTLATTTLARLNGYTESEDFQNKSVLVFVREGAANEDKIFHTDNDGSFVLGTTAMAWEDYRDLTISDVAGLTAALAGKSDTGHGHAQSDITDLVSDLAGKEPSIGAKGTAFNKNFGTSTGDVAEGDDARITGALQSSNDLSDLSDASTARSNLGLGDAAVADALFGLSKAGGLGGSASLTVTSNEASVSASHWGQVVLVDNSNLTEVTIPAGLPDGFFCFLYQVGTGKLKAVDDGTSSVTGASSSGDVLIQTNGQKTMMEIRQIASDSYCCFGSNLSIPDFFNQYSVGFPTLDQGNYISFDSTISCLNSASEFSIGCWMNAPSGTGSDNDFYTKDLSNVLGVYNGSTLQFELNNTNRYSGSFAFDGGWHFYVYTFNSGTGKVYVDGALEATYTGFITSTLSTFGASATIGGAPHPWTHFRGNIDMYGIWDTELSLAAITELYNLGAPIAYSVDTGNYSSSSNLQHYYKMGDDDGGTGTTITDSGNASSLVNLTLNGDCEIQQSVP